LSETGSPRHHRRLQVFLLKYFDAEQWSREYAEPGGWQFPYALDSMCNDDVELQWSDAARRPPWTNRLIQGLVRPLERLGAPFLDVLVSTRALGRADAVLSVFESQANAFALLRSLRIPPYTRPRLAVVSCWLAEESPRFSRSRRALYRFTYRRVDRVVYFSRNQTAVYRDVLRVPEERLACVPFGVDHEYFSPQELAEDDYVLAVGRDRGRDWATLFEAVRDTGLVVKIACRPGELGSLTVPANVEVLGTVDRSTYRALTARAKVVVVPTHVRAYPSGQSVLLEAMAMGKCCIVTDTPAIRDYVVDEHDGLLVSPNDAGALRGSLQRATQDRGLRLRLGSAARKAVEDSFTAEVMWDRIGEILGSINP